MSKFEIDWLVERSFTAENKKRYMEERYQPELHLWSKKTFEMKIFQAADVLESHEGTFTPHTYLSGSTFDCVLIIIKLFDQNNTQVYINGCRHWCAMEPL